MLRLTLKLWLAVQVLDFIGDPGYVEFFEKFDSVADIEIFCVN